MNGQDREIGTNGVEEHKHGGIKMSMTSRIITVLAVAGLFVAGAVGVGAQINWDTTEGHWLVPGNWDANAIPDGNIVQINAANAAVLLDDDPEAVGGEPWPTVNGDKLISIDRLRIGEDSAVSAENAPVVTFDHSGKVTADNSSYVGGSGGVGTLNILNGAFEVTGGRDFYVGTVSGSTGNLNMHAGQVGVAGTFFLGRAGGEGTFNMHNGQVDVDDRFFIGRETGGEGTFNMHSGTVSVDDDLFIGYSNGEGKFNMYGGTVNTDGHLNVGSRQAGTGTLNMYEGSTINASELRIAHRYTSVGGEIGRPTGTLNMYGGTINVSGGAGGDGRFEIGGWQGESGTFNMYSGAVVEISGTREQGIHIGRANAGTFRAWLDGSEFLPMTHTNQQLTLENAHLDVALIGGVMLTSESSFELIDAVGETSGSWTSTPDPDGLWVTTTENSNVSVELNTAAQRGTLNASQLGSQSNLDDGEDSEGEYSKGFAALSGLAEGENLVSLALGFKTDPTNHKKDGVDFVTALGNAGYYVWDAADLEKAFSSLKLGEVPANTIGIDMTVEVDEFGEGLAGFAWDLADYQTENPTQLELSSLTVIPEPSSIGLIVLSLAAVVRLRLRGRRNF